MHCSRTLAWGCSLELFKNSVNAGSSPPRIALSCSRDARSCTSCPLLFFKPSTWKSLQIQNISTFPQRYFHFQRYSEDLKISSWALRTSFRGKLDRQNSPSAKNRSLEICLNRCSLCWHSSHSNNAALSSLKSRNLTVVSMWWISAWSLERPRREEQTRNMRRSRRSSPD